MSETDKNIAPEAASKTNAALKDEKISNQDVKKDTSIIGFDRELLIKSEKSGTIFMFRKNVEIPLLTFFNKSSQLPYFGNCRY